MGVLPECLAHDDRSGRDLLYLQVPDAEAIVSLPPPGGHFTCLLVWDAAEESIDRVARVVEHLLDAGCVYVCTWGTGCELVHDIFDETLVGDGSQEIPEGQFIYTTWHSQEHLHDATWFFLTCADPDDGFKASCRSSLAIVVGEVDERRALVHQALSDPAGYSDRVVSAKEPCASRSGKPASCPRCGEASLSVEGMGACPTCLHVFRTTDD